ncbi:MAG: type II toxin-antitoxin system RelE family toxin [Dermatophilaceae bacterium]
MSQRPDATSTSKVLPPYHVQLLDHAKANFTDLDGSVRQPVAKQLRKLETSPQLGTPCENAAGIDLSGWLKLYLKTAGLRVIYAIVRDPTVREPKTTDEQGLVDVLAIGPRSDLSAYRGAEDELKRLGRHRSQRGRR